MVWRSDLIEAYVGRREDELRPSYELYVKVCLDSDQAPAPYEAWAEDVVPALILADSPKQRLEEYLHWNGIIGYTSAVFAIATGEV